MNNFLSTLVILLTFSATSACSGNQGLQEKRNQTIAMADTLKKSDAEWKKLLTKEEFEVLRNKGTERAFSGKYNKHKEEGIYTCAACANPLFSSETKFESGTGWPSFFAPIAEENIGLEDDRAYGMLRTEVVCGKCGGHLGHVFEDGPKPTGLRYCLNSVALNFQKI